MHLSPNDALHDGVVEECGMCRATPPPKPKELVVRLAPELHAELKADAEKNERSISGTIRVAIRQYLARQEAPF